MPATASSWVVVFKNRMSRPEPATKPTKRLASFTDRASDQGAILGALHSTIDLSVGVVVDDAARAAHGERPHSENYDQSQRR